MYPLVDKLYLMQPALMRALERVNKIPTTVPSRKSIILAETFLLVLDWLYVAYMTYNFDLAIFLNQFLTVISYTVGHIELCILMFVSRRAPNNLLTGDPNSVGWVCSKDPSISSGNLDMISHIVTWM
jgi:hypothetical protein